MAPAGNALGIAGLVLTGCLACGTAAHAAELPLFEAQVQRIDQLWSATPLAQETTQAFGAGVRKWSYRINDALPFPEIWPPGPDLVLVYYIHALAVNPQLRDAEVQAEPWARILVAKNGAQVQALDVAYRELGRQGVRPLRQDEIEILQRGPQIRDYVAGLRELPSDRDSLAVMTRAYYCLALRISPALGDIYASRHAAFVAWLGCAGN
jgi:hypothetical protein